MAVLRLTKAQLDGACGDPRFDQDFFVDLIFADVETESQAGWCRYCKKLLLFVCDM